MPTDDHASLTRESGRSALPDSADYDVPRPSKIKLKKTKAEIASKVHKQEQRRQAKLSSRISRANGLREDESTSPPPPPPLQVPRKRDHRFAMDEEDASDDDIVEVTFDPITGARWEVRVPRRRSESLDSADGPHRPHRPVRGTGNGSTSAPRPAAFDGPRQAAGQWAYETSDARYRSDGFGLHGSRLADVVDPFDFAGLAAGVRIPSRYAVPSAPLGGLGIAQQLFSNIRISHGSAGFSGGMGGLGNMSEREYTQHVRSEMAAKRRREEQEHRRREAEEKERRDIEREEKRRIREEKEEQAREEAERRREKEWRRARQYSAEAEMADHQRRRPPPPSVFDATSVRERERKERERYRTRWKALIETGGEIELVDLSFGDIPWPVYRPRSGQGTTILDLETDNVQRFLYALAAEEQGEVGTARKKVLREAIRALHPDRFFSRILPRVKGADKELVKEGAERCSRLINDLMSKL